MAFDMETLTGWGIPEDKAEAIIARHDEVINALKAEAEALEREAAELKPRAEEARRIQAEIDAYKEGNGGKDYKALYEAEKSAFDALKAEQEVKNTEERKREAYKALCRAEGVQARRLDSIARLIDVSSFRLDAAGNLENPDAIRADIRREWEDLIPAKGKGVYWHG